MGIAPLTDKIGARERVGFLALELSNMGGIEIAYQSRPGNVASKQTSWLPFPTPVHPWTGIELSAGF
jgi:hypothetical protein